MLEEKCKQATVTCPACAARLRYSRRLKIMRVQLCDEVINSLQSDVVDEGSNQFAEDFSRSARFSCPECGKLLQLQLDIRILKIEVINTADPAVLKGQPLQFTTEEQDVIETMSKAGLLEVYADVVRRQSMQNGHMPPKQLAANFLNFLRSAEKAKLSRRILESFIREFGGEISYYTRNGIGMVLSNGFVKMFVPLRSLYPNQKSGGPLNLHGVTLNRNVESIETLMHQHYGYVPANTKIFFQALRHSIGHFGREIGHVPLKPSK